MTAEFKKGATCLSRDGKEIGRLTGTTKRCRLEGCTGIRVGVRWDGDGNITWPCSKSLYQEKNGDWHLV